MWAAKYIGQRGVVSDYYQRIAVRVTCTDFLNSYPILFRSVTENFLRHLVLEIDLTCSAVGDLPLIILKMKELSKQTLLETHLHWTVEIRNYEIGNPLIRTIVQDIQPEIILIQKIHSKNRTIEAIHDLASVILDRKLLIGVSGMDLSEIQACFDSNCQISLVHIGCCLPTNIHIHFLEFCHSKGCNTMIDMLNTESDCLPSVVRCSEKYNRPPAVVLAKVILQIGALLCLPSSLLELDKLIESILRLNHPFTFLQTVYDPSLQTRFVLTNQEIEEISSESLLDETDKETSQMNRYTTRPHGRQLRNYSSIGLNLAQSNELSRRHQEFTETLEPQPEVE